MPPLVGAAQKDHSDLLVWYHDHILGAVLEHTYYGQEVIKRLPEFPEIMDKANQALTYLASGQIPQNSNSYTALNTKKSEMTSFRNQSIIGFLVWQKLVQLRQIESQ